PRSRRARWRASLPVSAGASARHDGAMPGKVAIVTGGARGSGRATATRLAQNGARVTAADLSAEAAYVTGHILDVDGGFIATGLLFDPNVA
ncbi:MAG: SDR family NAD(P)-dependent oxidoreductase, partial [Geminicoccaceae bacterium]